MFFTMEVLSIDTKLAIHIIVKDVDKLDKSVHYYYNK